MIVAGEVGRPSGLGQGARLLAAGLAMLDVPCWTIEAGLFAAAAEKTYPAGAPLLLHVNAPVLPASLLRLPRGLMRGRRVIGYWPWELPTVPPSWAVGARFVHEIWSPSRFSATALSGLMPGRVRVVPYPIAVVPPVPSGLRRADFGLPEAAVVTLVSFSLASSFARKNPLGAVAAFRAAFGDRQDRVLVLKVHGSAEAPADMAVIADAVAGCRNIRLETRSLPEADNHALTACADIVLSLHRSEGFGLVPAEAMLLRRCVVATDWSATAEFLDASCGVPVPFRLIPARDPRGVFQAPGAVWAEPDIGAAAAALRALADDAGRRAALGEAARAAAQAGLGLGGVRDAVISLGLRVAA
jgi:glycosyltransferase involved in cell wall biosynthesis